MRLCSKVDQKVPITALRLEFFFEAGEGMRTEIGHKFTPPMAECMLEEAGLPRRDGIQTKRGFSAWLSVGTEPIVKRP